MSSTDGSTAVFEKDAPFDPQWWPGWCSDIETTKPTVLIVGPSLQDLEARISELEKVVQEQGYLISELLNNGER